MLAIGSGQLRLYSSVKETPVDWLWYPYSPFGKVTLLQGDPGGGKSTLMMNIISAVSNGSADADGIRLKKPMHVIYQCCEDGASDTIKPRLMRAGADCSNVAFIDEDLESLTLNDDSLRRAIADFNAKLVVIDPFQAYLGDTDMASAASIRKVLRQIGFWAAAYDCAIVLIGHLNKKQGTKDLYRGLGSIDLVAAARSVLQVDICEESGMRVLRHIKSSLAPRGADLRFSIDSSSGIRWAGTAESDQPVPSVIEEYTEKVSKQDHTAKVILAMLANGPVKAADIRSRFKDDEISERTLMLTKKYLGIQSYRRGGVWYWVIPGKEV